MTSHHTTLFYLNLIFTLCNFVLFCAYQVTLFHQTSHCIFAIVFARIVFITWFLVPKIISYLLVKNRNGATYFDTWFFSLGQPNKFHFVSKVLLQHKKFLYVWQWQPKVVQTARYRNFQDTSKILFLPYVIIEIFDFDVRKWRSKSKHNPFFEYSRHVFSNARIKNLKSKMSKILVFYTYPEKFMEKIGKHRSCNN